jgi:hypothetical protein
MTDSKTNKKIAYVVFVQNVRFLRYPRLKTQSFTRVNS